MKIQIDTEPKLNLISARITVHNVKPETLAKLRARLGLYSAIVERELERQVGLKSKELLGDATKKEVTAIIESLFNLKDAKTTSSIFDLAGEEFDWLAKNEKE